MDRGLYTSASGGLRSSRRLEIVANNLANVNTVGYKAERLVNRQQEFSDTLASLLPGATARDQADHDQTPGVVDLQTITDFSQGPVSFTGNPLDVALRKDKQFFVVQTPEGEAYTRAGNFSVTVEGTIVTADGKPVLGDGGPLTLPPGTPRISGSGMVSVDGKDVGRLRVVEFADVKGLQRQGGARFLNRGGPAPQTVPADVVPESVELANVGTVESMVEMINTQRAFEAYTKTARTIDELNERALRNARPAN